MEHIKYRVYSLLIVFFFATHVKGQSVFYKTFSGSTFDYAEGITQLPDSGYAITGGSGAFSVNSAQTFLMLTDSLGNHLWTKSFGGNGSDWGKRVFYKPGIGFVIAGTTNSTSQGDYDFHLIFTDLNGDLVQQKKIGSINWEQLNDAVMLQDGGFILIGETEGSTTQGKDIFLVRVDDVGDTLWTKTIASGEDDVAYAADTLNDSTIIIGGYSWSGFSSNSFLVSVNINGQENWRNFYGPPTSSRIYDLQIYDQRIYCGGEKTLAGESQCDYWIFRTDNVGNIEADYSVQNTGEDRITSICVLDDSSFYAALNTDSQNLNVFPNGSDAFIYKFHTGVYYNNFSRGFQGTNPDYINQLIETNDKGLAFAGTCGNERVYESLGTAVMIGKIGPNDELPPFQADLGNDLVSIEIDNTLKQFAIYPNPSQGVFFIKGLNQNAEISLFSMMGEFLYQFEDNSKIDLTTFPNGVYTLNILVDGKQSIHKIVKR